MELCTLEDSCILEELVSTWRLETLFLSKYSLEYNLKYFLENNNNNYGFELLRDAFQRAQYYKYYHNNYVFSVLVLWYSLLVLVWELAMLV